MAIIAGNRSTWDPNGKMFKKNFLENSQLMKPKLYMSDHFMVLFKVDKTS